VPWPNEGKGAVGSSGLCTAASIVLNKKLKTVTPIEQLAAQRQRSLCTAAVEVIKHHLPFRAKPGLLDFSVTHSFCCLWLKAYFRALKSFTMRTLFLFFAATVVLSACANNETSTTSESSDSTTLKRDSTSTTESNTVTPPASNGQY
jgi:hypothetical protein